MEDNFAVYPRTDAQSNRRQFNMRKLAFAVSPPGQIAGRKRSKDEDDSTEEETEASLASVREQLRLQEEEDTKEVTSAVRDFFVMETIQWQRRYYRSTVGRVHSIFKQEHIEAITLEIQASLLYWAKWHADTFIDKLKLDTPEECAQFLDEYMLALANWSARGLQLQIYFSDYQDRYLRHDRGISNAARRAIDGQFVRNPILWDAVDTAVDKIVSGDKPMDKEMLDRIILLERVYSNDVNGAPVLFGVNAILSQDNDSGVKPDISTAPFSPITRVLKKISEYAVRQVSVRSAPNVLEDWAARAAFWTARVSVMFRYLLAEFEECQIISSRAKVTPESHTSHVYVKESLPLLLPHITAYALGQLPEIPSFIQFINSACAFEPTLTLICDSLATVMSKLTEILITEWTVKSLVGRFSWLDAARSRLSLLATPESEGPLQEKLTVAMKSAVKMNLGPLMVQLRQSNRANQKDFPTKILREFNLDLSLEGDDEDPDDMHARILAESVAVDLLPLNLCGSAVDAELEVKSWRHMADDFEDYGIAFTWMPVVMAAEAAKGPSNPVILHYVAWLTHLDPLLCDEPPSILVPFMNTGTRASYEMHKWNPAWSVVTVQFENATFDCSVIQYEFIDRLLKSSVPLPESTLLAVERHEREGASEARLTVLFDLIKRSKGFVRFDPERRLYALDASVAPSGSMAVARFASVEEGDS